MNQSVRTLVFLGVAVVCVGIGFATHTMYQPSDLEAFVDVGEPFYPDFTDPNSATGLRVASFNDETSKTDTFSVEFKDGLWRIPSHHDYPADGEEQLAKTAASMIGVERQALIERTKAAHKRYNLLDPLDKEVTGTEGRGDRITLYEGDEPLVDIIVGKPVDGQQNVYYIRAVGEDRFYTANLGDLNISTKFSDWIAKDILDISKSDVREIIVNRYSIDEARGVLVQGDRLTLTRPSSATDWALEGLNASKEELDSANVTELLNALDDLAIVGVRKKPEGISAGLKAEEGDGISTTRFDLMDLQEKGFFFDPQGGGILSNEGEVLLGTNQGVLYVLRFGEEFSGSDVDIEVGSKEKKDSDKPSEKKKAEKEKDESTEDKNESDDENGEGDSLVKSRYLFVTAQFDDSLIGEKPTPPVKPEPPKSDEKKPEATEEKADTDSKSDEAEESGESDPQKAYQKALEKYEEDLEVYEIKLKDYEEDLKKGQERVDDLNRRFADWYYVISADVFNRMKINRVDLVKKKEEPKAEEGEKPAITPGEPEVNKPEMKKEDSGENSPKTEAEPKKDSADKKESSVKEETSKATEKKDAEKKDAEKKDAEKKDAEKKDAEKKDAEKKDAEKKDAEKKDAEKAAQPKPEAPSEKTKKEETPKKSEAEKSEAAETKPAEGKTADQPKGETTPKEE